MARWQAALAARVWDAMIDLAVLLERLANRMYLWALAHRRPVVD